MDFGLARETDAGTLSTTGGIEGTPAFMAPEQARGENRLLDRRTDVYGMGATLYHILAGRPPFLGSSSPEILLGVLFNDPPALRKLDAAIPVDLETIVSKCMEKEPPRRYDSAKALAEDLGHFIDGTRIEARPLGRLVRLGRFVRRNKLLAASAGTALVASLLLGAVALRARWQAEAQARLAQELGQDIKELELFMRSAYGLPLHDIAREQAIVRRRMAQLEAKLRSADARSAAALHYALGRGHFVLHEVPAAQQELEQGWRGGYRTPEAKLALGLVLGERYRQELEQARRAGDKNWVDKQERELAAQYLQPALSYLEGADSSIEAPSYVQGLLALYRKQYDAALLLCQRAQAEAPWLAEPIKLEGDVEQARGIQRLDRGQWQEGRALLLRAAERHGAAASISRSDPVTYEATAIDWIRVMEADEETGAAVLESAQRAIAASEHAIAADPRGTYGLQLKAWAYWRWGFTLLRNENQGESQLKEAINLTRQAILRAPADWQAHYFYSLAAEGLGVLSQARGETAEHWQQENVAALRETLRLNPNFAWAWNDLGIFFIDKYREKQELGELDDAAFSEAASCFQRSAQLDPGYANPVSNGASLYLEKAIFLMTHGQDFAKEAEAARALLRQSNSIQKDSSFNNEILSSLLLSELEHAALLSIARSDLFVESRAVLDRIRALNPDEINTHYGIAYFYLLRALTQLDAGDDPGTAIKEGLAAIGAGEKRDAKNFRLAGMRARLLVVAGRALGKDPRAEPPLAQAQRSAQRGVAQAPKNAASYDILCEAQRYATAARLGRPSLSLRQRAEASAWIEQGLNACAAAIGINPTLATAYGNRGALLLLRARTQTAPNLRRLAAAQSVESLERSLAINKWLRNKYGPLLSEAQSLLR